MVVIPTDSDIEESVLSDDEITAQEPTLPTPLSILPFIHSLLRKELMYQDLSEALDDEQRNLILRSIELVKINDISYYNKNKDMFFSKVDSMLRFLGITFPTFYLPFANVDASTERSVTREHDLLRAVINTTWLMQKWSGSSRGYKILFRLFSRLGAVHLTSKYKIGSLIDQSTERIFRLIDINKLEAMNPSSPTFPDSVHIEGADSLIAIESLLFKWDTSRGWDEDNIITFDQSSASTDYGKGIALEFSLDRLLLVAPPNSLVRKSLMHNELLNAYATLLPLVEKAGVSIKLGSQLSLLTDTSGTFNNLSRESYTHPNIEAKFQIYKGKYVSSSTIRYIKTGDKGYNSLIRDGLFVPYDADPDTYEQPTDVEGNVASYIGYIGPNEVFPYGGFDVIHTMFHNRTIAVNNIKTTSIAVNGKNVADYNLKPTIITTDNDYVTPGSLMVELDVSLKRKVEYTVTGFTPITTPFSLTILKTTIQIPVLATSTSLIAFLKTQEFAGWSVEESDASTFILSALNTISNAHPLVNVVSSKFTLVATVLNPGENSSSFFQKIVLSEIGNPIINEYYGKASFKEMMSNNILWTEIQSDSITTDNMLSDYASAGTEGGYGAMSTRAFNLNPLTQLDTIPSLNQGIVSYVSGERLFTLGQALDVYPTASGSYLKTTWTAPDGWSTDNINVIASFAEPSFVRLTYNNATGADFSKSFSMTGCKVIVFRAKTSVAPADLQVDYEDGVTRHVGGTFTLTNAFKTYSCVVSSTVSDVHFLASNPALGLTIDIEGVYLGGIDNLTLLDSAIPSRSVIGTNLVREEGLYQNSFKFLGTGSSLIMAPTPSYPSTPDRTYSLHVEMAGDGTLVEQGPFTIEKTGDQLTFTAGFSGSSGVWVSTLPSSTLNGWVTISYSYLIDSDPVIMLDETILPAVKTAPVGSPLSGSASPFIIGQDLVAIIQEVRFFSKLVSLEDVQTIIQITPIKNDVLVNDRGDILTVFINHVKGFVVIKPSYNRDGIYKSLPSALSESSSYTPTIAQRYDLANYKGFSIISEIGLFDVDDVMVGYATFPPIVYDASKYHSSFNIMIRKEV